MHADRSLAECGFVNLCVMSAASLVLVTVVLLLLI